MPSYADTAITSSLRYFCVAKALFMVCATYERDTMSQGAPFHQYWVSISMHWV